MHESEVVSHAYISGLILFKNGYLYPLVFYIVGGLGGPAEVLNPRFEPPLVNKVEYLRVDLVLLELVIGLELHFPSGIDLHAYDLVDYLPLEETLSELL